MSGIEGPRRVVVIGDIHGRDIWKKIVEKEKGSVFVFLGDYFDSFDVGFSEQMSNFQDLMEFRKNNACICLLGNHDLHYLVDERYSGYQSNVAGVINALLSSENLMIIRTIRSIGKIFLFSHAGITKTWLGDNELLDVNDFGLNRFKFNGWDMYGDDITQGPLWVRPASLIRDGLQEYDGMKVVQVVGHTRQDSLVLDDDFIFCDTLDKGEYLIIDNGIGVGKVTF